MLKNLVFVGLGGAFGSMLRYLISVLTGRFQALPAEIGTFIANVLGSFCIGWLMSHCEKGSFYLFAVVGICGGFTTFSTFSAQVVSSLQSGRYTFAFAYMLLSLCVCFLFTWAGMKWGVRS